jgi:PKD repeat protein
MEAWVNSVVSDQDQKILGKFNTLDNYFIMGIYGNLHYSQIYANGQEINFALGNITSGEWTHLAVTFSKGNGGNNGTCYGYVNGEVVFSKTDVSDNAINVNNAGFPFRIGVAPWDINAFHTIGNIDEVRIWNSNRSQTEIRENMFRTLAGTEPGLLSYYQLNESSGTIAVDAISGNNGTLHNMTDDDWVNSTAPVGVPVINTTLATNITQTTAISGGEVTFEGGANVTTRGVCWSTNENPTINDDYTIDGTGTGDFISSISGLSASTKFYHRAYATNSIGINYGEEKFFYTIPNGSGISGDPYQIATLYNLRWLSETSAQWDKYYIQTANIDASDTFYWNGGAGFSPIGNFSIKFTGDYDGQGFEIAGLFIDLPSNPYIGLFGYTWGASFTDLRVINADITGEYYVGGLVGFNRESSSITNCCSTGSVNGTANNVGGLVGRNSDSTTTNSYSTGNVSGNDFIGGLVGENTDSTITNSYSTGNVSGLFYIGGLVGSSGTSTIINCYSTGGVSGNVFVGGLVGEIGEFSGNGSVLNSYSTGNVSGVVDVGGLVGRGYDDTINNSFWDTRTSGQNYSFGGTGKTTAEMQTESTFTDAGWDFIVETINGNEDLWGLADEINSGYPIFVWQTDILAHFASSPIEVFPGTEIQFTDESYDDVSVWQWDFDNDGIYDSTEQNPTFVYPSTGLYSIKLTVSDGIVTNSYTRIDYIYVNTIPKEPLNMQIVLDGDDAVISWDEVTEDIDDVPINVDGYIVKFSEDNEHFFFLFITPDLSHTHLNVVIHSPQMFYKILAYKSYSSIELKYLQDLNNNKKKIKWEEVKRELGKTQ